MASMAMSKYERFMAKPFGDRAVGDMPGIGPKLESRLLAGVTVDRTIIIFDKAEMVIGQFLVFNKKRDVFFQWMMELSRASGKQRGAFANAINRCLQCLSECCRKYLSSGRLPVRGKIGDVDICVEDLSITSILIDKKFAKDVESANRLVGKFLVFNKRREPFVNWMQDKCGSSSRQSDQCFQCLSHWYTESLTTYDAVRRLIKAYI